MALVYEKILYKKGSGGKLKIWWIELFDDGTERTSTGYHGMKLKSTSKHSAGDAEKKASTKAEKKMREGYVEDIKQAEEANVTLSGMQAMFMSFEEAAKFVDDRHKQGIKSKLLCDFKLNGLRGTYHRDRDEIISKGNKVYNVEHIRRELEVFCDLNKLAYLDFEFYRDGLKVNEIQSLVKNTDKDQTTLFAYIFDVLESKEDKTCARDRKCRLGLCDFSQTEYLKPLLGQAIINSTDLYVLWKDALNTKLEGLVLRDPELPYDWDNKGRRSTVMIKVKPLYSSEFLAVGCSFERRKVNGVWHDLILYVCQTEDGRTFTVTPEGDFESRNIKCPEFNEDSWYTVEYRELTTNGIPFHAVGKGFRIKEDLAVDC